MMTDRLSATAGTALTPPPPSCSGVGGYTAALRRMVKCQPSSFLPFTARALPPMLIKEALTDTQAWGNGRRDWQGCCTLITDSDYGLGLRPKRVLRVSKNCLKALYIGRLAAPNHPIWGVAPR